MSRQGAEDAKLPEPDFELDLTARVVVDAAAEVHRILGPGLLQSVYEQALLGLLINFNVCLLRQGVRRVIPSR